MVKGNRLDFTGQSIYVGMDVHKKNWSVSIHTRDFEHKTFTQPPEVEVLANYLKRTFPGATYHAVYEAGFSGFWIDERLREQGIHSMVVNPADVPTKDKERAGKADRVDCRKLARNLRNGDLRGIHVPSREQLEDRHLIRTRQSMVRKQTRCKNQIKSILYFYGVPIPDKGHWSGRFLQWIEETRLKKASGNLALQSHLDELKYLRKIIADLSKAILALSRTEKYQADVALLRSVPGISTLTAMTLLTELYTIRRFSSLDHLVSYAGLIPQIKSSGEEEYTSGVTHRRNAVLRTVLVEASWVAVRKDPAMAMAFLKLSRRMKKTKAIIAIARKLLNRIRFVLKNQQPYVPACV